MKKKTIWVALSCLLVAILVLASCQSATEDEDEGTTITGDVTEGETTETEEEEEAEQGHEMVQNVLGKMVEKPQYGGTIRYRLRPSNTEHFDWLFWEGNSMCSIICDRLTTVPWDKGPAGTNENAINYSWYTENWFAGQ